MNMKMKILALIVLTASIESTFASQDAQTLCGKIVAIEQRSDVVYAVIKNADTEHAIQIQQQLVSLASSAMSAKLDACVLLDKKAAIKGVSTLTVTNRDN